MYKLRVTCPADELSFMQIGDIITDYEVVHDSLTALIKVNTSSYAKDNKFKENGRLMLWESENFWINFGNIEIIKDEGEINSIDICRLNKDIMSKEQIIECMKYPRCGFYKDYLKEIKPTFTMLEKLLLEHQLEMGYKYITRDETARRLNFFRKKPINNGSSWYGNKENDYSVFDMQLKELYPFVSCEDKEPTLIQDILDNYEVVENEKI